MHNTIQKTDKQDTNIWPTIKYIINFIDEIESVSWLEINLEDKERIERAYLMAKHAFWDQMRDNKSRTFFHTKRVCLILSNFDNVSVDDIIISILHDVIEDTDKSYEDISEIFWSVIANRVKTLSKKEWGDFMYDIPKKLLRRNERKYLETRKKIEETKNLHHIKDYKETEEFIHAETKNRRVKMTKNIKRRSRHLRNEEYFWKMNNLSDWDLMVKLADRIDWLYTMQDLRPSKAKRKIEETIKYFLPVAKKRFPMIYRIMAKQVNQVIREKKLKIKIVRLASDIQRKTRKDVEKIISIENYIWDIQKSYAWKAEEIIVPGNDETILEEKIW